MALAIAHEPPVLILDEPLNGTDPVQRAHLIDLFHRLGDDGRCVLVSSHVLDEVARLGSRVLVIAQGRLVASGDYRDLRELMDDRAHRIGVGASDPRRLAAALVDKVLGEGANVIASRKGAELVGIFEAPVDRAAPVERRTALRSTPSGAATGRPGMRCAAASTRLDRPC